MSDSVFVIECWHKDCNFNEVAVGDEMVKPNGRTYIAYLSDRTLWDLHNANAHNTGPLAD